jgi:hypothetical protein
VQVAATLALVVLFFLLQAPRKDPLREEAEAVVSRAAVVASELEVTAAQTAKRLEESDV